MKLLLAQGNPGPHYARTRHNIGFMVLDYLANSHNAAWKKSRIAHAETAEITIASEKVLLIKPASFYNETGPVAHTFLHFHKLRPEALLVIHDELALPFGTIRVRNSGSDAGNNGIKSLIQHVGADFWRIRIGIWNEDRERIDDAQFVLSAFSGTETDELKTLITKTALLAEDFAHGTLTASTH